MGELGAFLKLARVEGPERDPGERVHDYSEFVGTLPVAGLQEQGARCMECGVPFCHSGCPVNNLIPDWNDLVYKGNWREAVDSLHSTNNFPEFTSRICPAPCEAACTLNIQQTPVGIKAVEHAIIDKAGENGWVAPQPTKKKTGRKVAIVGSGPAGLAAAQQLNRAGHLVTVFERDDRPGGLMLYGIPAMKLDKRLVERRIDLLRAEGIVFETGVEVGRDIEPADLLAGSDAVVLCTGATVARELPSPGRDLAGIHLAMDFLRGSTKALLDGQGRPPAISAAGRDVVVIGGGDTGTDCVATAIRQGARSLVQLEILPRPPDERAPDNPWPQWPRIYRLDYGQEEAAALWGGDPRRYAVATRRFVPGPDGRVAGIEIVDVAWAPGPDGRLAPVEQPGSERTLPADLVLLALGFSGPERGLPEQLGCAIDARGTILVDEAHESSVPGVFAAGDCRRGQSLVVWAIREGRRAANGVEEHLSSIVPRWT